MRLGINQHVNNCWLGTLLVQGSLFQKERSLWGLKINKYQLNLIEFEIITLLLENGRICISEQLIHWPPDDRDCLLGLPFILIMYLPILLSLSRSSRIYIPPTTPMHLGQPRAGRPALSAVRSFLKDRDAQLEIASSVTPAIVASLYITKCFSFNLFHGLGVHLRFLFGSDIQVCVSFLTLQSQGF